LGNEAEDGRRLSGCAAALALVLAPLTHASVTKAAAAEFVIEDVSISMAKGCGHILML